MIVHSLHPIDGILADVGMMARRAVAGTLTPTEYRAIAARIRDGVAAQGADPGGMIGAFMDALDLNADAQSITHQMVKATMDRIRGRLIRVRDGSLPVVPNFAVIPHGVHGRPYDPLTAIDGGRAPDPANEGA